jgi:hypothetical protein
MTMRGQQRRLVGQGLIIAEGQEEQEGISVNYNVLVLHKTIVPMHGDSEHAAGFEVSAYVYPASALKTLNPTPDYYFLQLSDRRRIKVYPDGIEADRYILKILDASELFDKMGEEGKVKCPVCGALFTPEWYERPNLPRRAGKLQLWTKCSNGHESSDRQISGA